MPFRRARGLGIPGLLLLEPVVYPDHRGFFAELFREGELSRAGVGARFVQANMSRSRRGVVRGLHYQLRPAEQGKLVTVVQGRVLDVAVDIRRGSPWYGEHEAVELSADPPTLLWIPPGFAHGFQALEDATVIYLVTKEYSPRHERCIAWDDPELGVEWPLKREAILSEKDKKCPPLREAETNFQYYDKPYS